MMDERSKKFLEQSEVMQEVHKKAQEDGAGCLGTKKLGDETGLVYRDGGKIECRGGYIPNRNGSRVISGGIKEALIRWRWIDSDIGDIQREMRILESRFNDPAIASYIERMEKRVGGGKTGIEDLLIEREKLEGQFMDELEYLLKVRAEIHRFVGMLDEIDREAITLRYLKGYDWKTVSQIMKRNLTKLCFRVNTVLEHYDRTGQYLSIKRYRKHTIAK